MDNMASYQAYRSAYWVCKEEGHVLEGTAETSIEGMKTYFKLYLSIAKNFDHFLYYRLIFCHFSVKCKSDGKFDTPPSPLKKCEKPANCTATVPVPPVSQGNSTGQVNLDPAKTVPVTVVDYAEYFCNDTTYYAGKRTKSKIYHTISRTFTLLK